jgi:hypothetical protein
MTVYDICKIDKIAILVKTQVLTSLISMGYSPYICIGVIFELMVRYMYLLGCDDVGIFHSFSTIEYNL